jgi:hypothetical protein
MFILQSSRRLLIRIASCQEVFLDNQVRFLHDLWRGRTRSPRFQICISVVLEIVAGVSFDDRKIGELKQVF